MTIGQRFALAAAFIVALQVVPRAQIEPRAADYLNEVLDLMQRYSVNRSKIEWPAFRAKVTALAASAKGIPGLDDAIAAAIKMLNDGQSSFTPVKGRTLAAGAACRADPVSPVQAPPSLGVVTVRGFSGSRAATDAFAEEMQRSIAAQDRSDLAGWIVDLRGNGGGNMWAMLAGVGPLLDRELVGFFSYPSGSSRRWRYVDGASYLETSRVAAVTAPYRLLKTAPRIALLIDGKVAGSGEATVLAFRGQQGTRIFGQKSCGYTSLTQALPLSDGSTLRLVTGFMTDRTDTQFNGPIEPDEVMRTQAATVSRAIEWLQTPAAR